VVVSIHKVSLRPARAGPSQLLATDPEVAAGWHHPVEFHRIDVQRLAQGRRRLLDY
jgi:hypothetical protein